MTLHEKKPYGPTCKDVALENLEQRSIRDSTYRNYLQTLKALDLEDVPFSEASIRFVSRRLQRILTESTRRKHATNIRSMLGIKVPLPRAKSKAYELPDFQEVVEAFRDSRYELQAFSSLFAGMRLGEACVRQKIKGTTILIDKQRTPDHQILPAKSSGPVIVPSWFAEMYREADDFSKHHATIHTGIKRRSLYMLGTELSPHMLRHLFACHLVDNGATPKQLQMQMRHTKVETSLTFYTHARQRDLSDLMNRLGN